MRVKQTYTRGVGNYIFYVDELEQKGKNAKNWEPAGFQVKIKNLKTNPIILEKWPTNEDLNHLIGRWR